MIWLSYLATVLVLVAVYLIGKPKLAGQYLALVANCLWIIYAAGTEQWPLMIQSLVLACLSATALRNWKAKGIGK